MVGKTITFIFLFLAYNYIEPYDYISINLTK